MWHARDGDPDRWAAVSRATQIASLWRSARRRRQVQAARVRFGLRLVRIGLRLAAPAAGVSSTPACP